MILYIDTIDFNSVTYGIKIANKIVKKVFKIDPHQSHETLLKLDEFFKKV